MSKCIVWREKKNNTAFGNAKIYMKKNVTAMVMITVVLSYEDMDI